MNKIESKKLRSEDLFRFTILCDVLRTLFPLLITFGFGGWLGGLVLGGLG